MAYRPEFLLVLRLTKLVNELEIEVLIFVFQVRGLCFCIQDRAFGHI